MYFAGLGTEVLKFVVDFPFIEIIIFDYAIFINTCGFYGLYAPGPSCIYSFSLGLKNFLVFGIEEDGEVFILEDLFHIFVLYVNYFVLICTNTRILIFLNEGGFVIKNDTLFVSFTH